ncbi:DUF2750 domain-containing protein [Actinoplanes sp. NPDC051851]|uniref:DUF2750 domain-containing protein n=1 Tax=Actinoplanes sp. NPDC051851 TaxID=3154753 RepID=UPI0034495BAE
MSASGPQTAAFFREIAERRTVWWVRNDDGGPTFILESGDEVFPYWSSEKRSRTAAALWGPGYRPVSMPLDRWRDRALPDLAREDLRIGVNWTGERLTGWDLTVPEVLNRLEHALRQYRH